MKYEKVYKVTVQEIKSKATKGNINLSHAEHFKYVPCNHIQLGISVFYLDRAPRRGRPSPRAREFIPTRGKTRTPFFHKLSEYEIPN